MKTKSKLSAYILRGGTAALLFSCVIVALCSAVNLREQPLKPRPPQDNAAFGANAQQNRTLSFAERVAYQRAIEDVYWRHRIWPRNRGERPDPKPSLDAVMSQAEIEKKVEDYLRNSQALEDYGQRPITADQLQAEMERMASHTKQPEVLGELFAALGNDPFVIAECLARPALAERLAAGTTVVAEPALSASRTGSPRRVRPVPDVSPASTKLFATPNAFGAASTENRFRATNRGVTSYHLPVIASPSGGVCTDNTWTPTTLTNVPEGRATFTAVWTGSEMIIWGGENDSGFLNTGGEYNPSTDSWTATSTSDAPAARAEHSAVWTGTEMIVWGGDTFGAVRLDSGGRYNPSTDSWTATSTFNAPEARRSHSAVWTGTEMIVWGGEGQPLVLLNTGGRYDPSTDSWTATSTTNAPEVRFAHSAVWTGTEMIIWGGFKFAVADFDTGGRYDPSTDTWTATSTSDAPDPRRRHSAVWTGSEMIVWGGFYCDFGCFYLNTGGRYDPGTDSWTATSTTGAPAGRAHHTAVWTGSEMIVWGGNANGPDGGEFIDCSRCLNTGSRYCAGGPSPTPTPTPRIAPIPRARPTPAPRP